jgi:tetratricopeptide (TPR) repeat protein
MVAKLEERYLRVYCPTHKVSFTVLEAGVIVCEGGSETLAQNFPYEEFWEYCCDCQSLWPSNLSKGKKAGEQCFVCSREIKRRFICDQCKVISLESDGATRRKAFTISRGIVEPRCPGCLNTGATVNVREHYCDEAGAEFTTTHTTCPFCDEQVADRPTFPILAAEYLNKIRAKKITCKFNPQDNLLQEAEDGEFVVVSNGSGTSLSIIVPKLTRFSSRQDYYNYKDYYDCDDPDAGEVFIVYPAAADKLEDGWKLREVGRLKVKRHDTPVQAPIAEVKTESTNHLIICPQCGTAGKAEDDFCSECGFTLGSNQPSASSSEQEMADTIGQSFNSSATTIAQHQPNKLLRRSVVLAVCAAIILGIIAITRLSGSNTAESKLENAIAKGNLISPSGESAYDYYQQLKREGTSGSTLAKFDNKLLPLLTSRSQEMFSNAARPDGRDATLSEWEETAKLLSWASELKPSDTSLEARSAYCKGRVAYLNKRIDEALNLWKRASDLDRSWGLPVQDSGYVYLKEKNFKNPSMARDFFTEAIHREENWAVPYLYSGDTYYVQKSYDSARSFYEDAVRLAPQWARAHAALGNLAKLRGDQYMSQSNYDSARDEYLKAKQELELALELANKSPGNFSRKGVDDDLHDVRQRLEQLDNLGD